ncbi:MAG: hypothetical protein JW819_03315 [Candidatus Krumholzibacteriota bacterium]|nr:hypothetical protein [Candidatus Krumholzibacteriota bacterium]
MLVFTGGDLISNKRGREAEMQSRFLLEMIGATGIDVYAVQAQDYFLGRDVLEDLARKHDLPLTCANLVDAQNKPVYPGYRVFELDGKRLGVLVVTDPRMQHNADMLLEAGLHFTEPEPAVAEGVRRLREEERCDAVVLLYGGRRDQALDGLRTQAGIDLILYGNASVSQRVPAETEAGVSIYTAAARGKDFGEIALTMKDGGGAELSPIKIHELNKEYPDDPAVRARLDAFNAEAADRRKREKLIEQLARDTSDTPTTDTYIGTELCARCHVADLHIFEKTAHAHAMDTLERLVQDNNPDCVGCHVTGWGRPGGYGLNAHNKEMLKHVQCEACHGYGTAHDRGPVAAMRARESCLVCHTEENSPEFDFVAYWARIEH